MISSLPELTSYTGGWEGVRSRPSEPCYICHSNGREPYQSTYFLVIAIVSLSYLSIFCTNSVIVMSYSDYNLKQNYTHYSVNSKIRSVSTDLSFFSRKNFIPFCVAIKDCLKTIRHISGVTSSLMSSTRFTPDIQ